MSPLWKAIVVANFLMLSILTWAAGPLQKMYEKTQHREQVRAQAKVCDEIYSRHDLYQARTRAMFVSGCMWDKRSLMIASVLKKLNTSATPALTRLEVAQRVDEFFKNKETPEYETMANHCAEGAADYFYEGNIDDVMVHELFNELLQCPKVYDEAKKLGIEG